MTAVFQEISLSWGGEEYNITPDMALLQRIEQKYSLSSIAHRTNEGQPPLSHVAGVVAIMLKSAGCKDVTQEGVYGTMFAEGPDFIMSVTNAILSAAFPAMPGNAEAPDASGAAKKKTSKK